MQVLPAQVDHISIEWKRRFYFQGDYKGGDAIGDIACILWNHIEDFKEGEECCHDVDCQFVRKYVCKHTTQLQPQPTSFIKKSR